MEDWPVVVLYQTVILEEIFLGTSSGTSFCFIDWFKLLLTHKYTPSSVWRTVFLEPIKVDLSD